jgi:HNH/endonuclease VII toxin of polymorphic toxin system
VHAPGPRTPLAPDASAPPSQGATLAVMALDLQRTAGNRATGAVLARQRRKNVYPDFTSLPKSDMPIAAARARTLEKQLGINVPRDRILDAPWVGRIYRKGMPDPSLSTSAGWLRNSGKFWKAFKERWPEDYALLGRNHRVTKAFAERYGWPKTTIGQKLVHHHIGNSSHVVAIPEDLHLKLSGAIHAKTTVIKPTLRPPLRAGLGKSLGKAAVKGLLRQLPGLVVGAFVGYLEGKLNEVNQEQIARSWKNKIGPVIGPALEAELDSVASNEARFKHRLYATVGWDLVTQEQSRELADAAWWVLRFWAGEPGFSEVFHEVRVPKDVSIWWTLKPPPAEKGRRRPTEYKEAGWTYRVYHERTTILVSDPAVWQAYELLRQARNDTAALWENALDEIEALGGLGDFRTFDLQIALREEDYGDAARCARELADSLDEDFGSTASHSAGGVLREMAVLCEGYWTQLMTECSAMDRQQRNLLQALAPGFPPSRKKLPIVLEPATKRG